MAVTQVNGTNTGTAPSSGGAGAGTLTINKPTGVVAGDVMIAGVTSDSTTPTAPSGWTQFAGGLHGGASWNVNLYYRVVTGSEGSSFSWTVGTVGPAAGYIAAYSGCDTSSPLAVVANREDNADVLENGTITENLGPTVNTSPVATGRLFYVRAVRKSSAAGAVATLSSPDDPGTIGRRTTIGKVSESNATSYTIALFSNNSNFSGAGSYAGADIRCDITESTNWFFTFALAGFAATSANAAEMTHPATTANKPTPTVKVLPTVIG